MDLESKVTGIFGRGMRRGRSSSSWNRRMSQKCPPAEAPTAWVSMAYGAQRVDRAETGGAQGEGATVVKHDDGGGIRAVPPFVEAYTKITRPLGRLIVDLARFMTLADIAGWLLLSWDTVKTVVQRRLEKDYQRT